jgi:protein TonB
MAPRVRPRELGEPAAAAGMPAREPAWRRTRLGPLRPTEPPLPVVAPEVTLVGRVAGRPAVAPSFARSGGAAAWLLSLLAHAALAAVFLLPGARPEEGRGEPAIEVTLVSEDVPVGDAEADARAASETSSPPAEISVAAPPDVALLQTPPDIPPAEVEAPLPEVDVPLPEPAPPVVMAVPEVDVPLPEPAPPVAITVPEVDVPLPEPAPALALIAPPEPAPEIGVPLPEPVPPVAMPHEPVAEVAAEVGVPLPEPVPPPVLPPEPPVVTPPKTGTPPPRLSAKAETRPKPSKPVAKAAPKPVPARAAPASAKAAAVPADGENRADRTRGQAAAGGANGASAAAVTSWRAAVQAAILRRKPAPDDEREGLVRVGFSIGLSGDVAGVRIASSSGVAALDAAALAAVRRAAPFPPVPPGLNAPVAMEVPIRFQIQ